jgi:hypothetical protein
MRSVRRAAAKITGEQNSASAAATAASQAALAANVSTGYSFPVSVAGGAARASG